MTGTIDEKVAGRNGGGIGCFMAVSGGEGTPCPIGGGLPACGFRGALHREANIDNYR